MQANKANTLLGAEGRGHLSGGSFQRPTTALSPNTQLRESRGSPPSQTSITPWTHPLQGPWHACTDRLWTDLEQEEAGQVRSRLCSACWGMQASSPAAWSGEAREYPQPHRHAYGFTLSLLRKPVKKWRYLPPADFTSESYPLTSTPASHDPQL